MSLVFAAVIALALAQPPGIAEPKRILDVELAVFTSLPERVTGCLAGHFGSAVEVDVCGHGDTATLAMSSHAFLRNSWWLSQGLSLALGGGIGARLMRFCPFALCAFAAGPEALASFEAVKWLTPCVGVTLQLDAGVALLIADGGNVRELLLRFPLRAMVGIAL